MERWWSSTLRRGAPTDHIGWARLGDEALVAILRRVDEAQPIGMASTRPYGDGLGVGTAGLYFTLNTLEPKELSTRMHLSGGILLASRNDGAAT